MFKFYLTAALGGLFVCACGSVAAGNSGEKSAPVKHSPTPAESGMKAYVDPETGALTGKPGSKAQAEATALPAPDMSKIQEIRHADGSLEWVFNGQAEEALVATRGSDGTLKVRCAQHGVVHDHADDAKETANDR